MFPQLTDTRRFRAVLPLLLGLAGLLLPACSRPEPPAGSAQILRLSQRNEPATLDPQLATLPDEFFIIRALSEGLVSPDPAGGPPRPAAAESWSVSADGLTWTFRLRPGARWSNGQPVTADDFVFSARRILTPAFAAPKAQMFFAVRHAAAFHRGTVTDFTAVGFAAPDPHTLVITLAHPDPDFLALAASGPWIPVHRAAVAPLTGPNPRDGAWTRPHRFVGNGPFVLTAWRPHQHLEVRRNSAYHAVATVRLDGLRFLAFDNGEAEERAFRTGQVQVTMAVPASKLPAYRTAQPPVLRSVPLHETRYLALNVTRPPLDRPDVRRALSLALDRSALTALLGGGQRPALSFIPPGLGGYTPASALTEDATAARRLLATAGFPEGRGFPALEFSAWGVTPALLEAIQQQWKQVLGIDVAIVQREARTHLAALAAGDFAIGFITAIPDYDSAADLLADLQPDGAGNYPQWRHPGYDRLVTAALATADPAARLAGFHAAEALLLHELPVVPLYFNAQNFLVAPAVQGWQADALWTRFYSHVSLHEP